MFGRIRPLSSPDNLERPHLKMVKQDSMSIYEKTLMKLRLGSKLDLGPPEAKPDSASPSSFPQGLRDSPVPETTGEEISPFVSSKDDEAAYMDADFSASDFHSEQPHCRNLSLVDLFSRFAQRAESEKERSPSGFDKSPMLPEAEFASSM